MLLATCCSQTELVDGGVWRKHNLGLRLWWESAPVPEGREEWALGTRNLSLPAILWSRVSRIVSRGSEEWSYEARRPIRWVQNRASHTNRLPTTKGFSHLFDKCLKFLFFLRVILGDKISLLKTPRYINKYSCAIYSFGFMTLSVWSVRPLWLKVWIWRSIEKPDMQSPKSKALKSAKVKIYKLGKKLDWGC